MSSNTIVLGAGIIGLSTAYYLSQHQPPSTIHIVDPNPRLFRATASGLAAGFLARDWFPAATAALGRLSFDEHARLAAREGGREKWGYSRSIAWTYTRRPRTPSCSKKERVSRERGEDWLRTGTSRAEASGSGNGVDRLPEDGPEWLRRVRGDSVEAISDTGTTAQV